MTKLPTIGQLPTWRTYVCTACVEASNQKDEGPIVKWLTEVDADGRQLSDFAHSGKGFEVLDRKLAAALRRICGDELGRRVTQEETIANTRNMTLKGRQI